MLPRSHGFSLLGRVGAFALALAPAAQAETEPSQHWDVAARGGFLGSTRFFAAVGLLFGVEAGYRLAPAWRAGAYLESVVLSSGSSDHVLYDGEEFKAVRFGARGQWHARADKVVDPWFGASIGAFRASSSVDSTTTYAQHEIFRWGAEVGFDVGLDFHIGRTFTVGPVFTATVPLGNGRATNSAGQATGTPVGVYYSALPITNIPIPLIRAGLAF